MIENSDKGMSINDIAWKIYNQLQQKYPDDFSEVFSDIYMIEAIYTAILGRSIGADKNTPLDK